jgi:hypothetical protein
VAVPGSPFQPSLMFVLTAISMPKKGEWEGEIHKRYAMLERAARGQTLKLIMNNIMKNTYCLFQIEFITEYTNIQRVIITQILLKQFN